MKESSKSMLAQMFSGARTIPSGEPTKVTIEESPKEGEGENSGSREEDKDKSRQQ